MKFRICTAIIVAAFMTVASLNAFAHDGATGIVKERMDMMSGLAASMKAFAKIIKGRDKYEVEKLQEIARQFKQHGGANLTKLFPDGSLIKPTNAVPEIWQDWETFSSIAETLSDEASAL